MLRSLPLRSLALIWMLAAFICGLSAAALWNHSQRAWQNHLITAYEAGFAVYEALREQRSTPKGVTITPLSDAENALADLGQFARMPDAPQPTFVTNASILANSGDSFTGEILTLAIVSGDLQYSAAAIASSPYATAPQKMAEITRMLASYCSEPIIYAFYGNRSWYKIDGTELWGCKSAPKDLRLIAVGIAMLGMAILYTLVVDTTATFGRFAATLRNRRRLGGPEAYQTEGPMELRDMVDAVNSYLAAERAQLSHRAVVLSGVSHDLGTPATRLRLRAALIPDDDLRSKLEHDIDQMTGMIESVLTYTRSEMSAEEPRKLSLSSLIQSIVDDYQDMGKPVTLMDQPPAQIEASHSVFAARPMMAHMPDAQKMLATVRMVSLQRAVTNLIDNALKYGRRAHVGLIADSQTATIIVEDEGTFSPDDMAALIAPFQRGANVGSVNGYGLGLTIVEAVADQHGGTLEFIRGRRGLRAQITIQRA